MIHTMPRTLVKAQEHTYGQGLVRTNIMVHPDDWEAYQAICKELGITASAGLRQMMRRVVRGHRANG